MDEERTRGGSRIFRHKARLVPDEPSSPADPALIEAIQRHLVDCFGEGDHPVFHELVSTSVHIDVHLVPPSAEYPFQRLVTSGMAELPMTMPRRLETSRYAELTIALPRDWPVKSQKDSAYWPIRLLKDLARLPHEYKTFLNCGATVPNGEPPKRYARGTELCCAFIVPPLTAPDGFDTLELADRRRVNILGILPLHDGEMDYKLEHGVDALCDLLDDHGIGDVIDPGRPSLVPRKRRRLGR